MTDRTAGQPAGRKSEDAYRTISEVAADLDVPQHVLRFWETRFPQVKPLKRAGGRRFYRPEDVALLRAVRVLLYDEGYTIKGVQRLLAEHGARPVADALARSRSAAPPGHGGRRDGGGGAAVPMEHAVRREPASPMPPGPAAARGPVEPAAPTADEAGVAGRLSAVLADLAECARLLASLRST